MGPTPEGHLQISQGGIDIRMRRFALVATVLVLVFASLAVAKTADPGEIHSVLVRDAIPAVINPAFGLGGIEGGTAVLGLAVGGDARAYPVPILSNHEIVDDVVGGVPVAVTYCPLCGTGIAFDRRAQGHVLTLKVSGKLLQNNLVMYDVETNSQWSQLLGQALTGPLAGSRLEVIPSAMTTFEAWRSLYPGTKVLSPPPTGRDYSSDPYDPYYASDDTLFPVRVPDRAMHPKAFVLGVSLNGEAVAFPYEVLRRSPVVNTTVGGVPIVVTFQLGYASAWERDGHAFSYASGRTMVDERGRPWDTAGGASMDGAERLDPAQAIPSFWFAWKDFHPDTKVYGTPTPYNGTFNSGFVLSTAFFQVLLVIFVVIVAARNLYRHFLKRGPWADPKWRTTGGQAFWAFIGAAFGAFAVSDGLDSLGPLYRLGEVVLGVAFVGLGIHLAWQAAASLGYEIRQSALGAEATRHRIEETLRRSWEASEGRSVADRLHLNRGIRRYDIAGGGALEVDGLGNVFVARRGVGQARAVALKALAEDALLMGGPSARGAQGPVEGS